MEDNEGKNFTYNKDTKRATITKKLSKDELGVGLFYEDDDVSDLFSGLYVQQQDNSRSIDGKPTYYFRGNVQNNYVNFANLTWRIVRINEDKTIRLVLNNNPIETNWNDYNFSSRDVLYKYCIDNKNGPPHKSNICEGAYMGYTYNKDYGIACKNDDPCISDYDSINNKFVFKNSKGKIESYDSEIKKSLEEWYITNHINEEKYNNKIALGYFCNDLSNYYAYDGVGNSNFGVNRYIFSTYLRLMEENTYPSFVCPDPKYNFNRYSETSEETKESADLNYGGVYKLKVGLLSADEMNYAGLPAGMHEYLDFKNYLTHTNNAEKMEKIWSMSPLNGHQVLTLSGQEYVLHGTYIIGGLIVYNGIYKRTPKGAPYVELTTYSVSDGIVINENDVYPVINLKNDVIWNSGNGTEEHPYTIALE